MGVCLESGTSWHIIWSWFVIGAQKFKDAFEAAQEKVSVKSDKDEEAADETAGLLDNLKVEGEPKDEAEAATVTGNEVPDHKDD